MTATIDGPLRHGTPIPVYIGEDLVLQVAVRDGVPNAAARNGALVSVAASAKKGVLRIYKPDGVTNVTRDTSVSGEGEKADDDADATNDSYRFLVASTVTALWAEGRVAWEVEHQDSSTTPTTARLIAYGWLEVRAKPSSSGVAPAP